MKSSEIRRTFLEFFRERGHEIIPSSSLVPFRDSTTLFVSAGMQPLVRYLYGEKHPSGKRLADIQKCIRTIDIEEVGDESHLTFFEMLGNWSLGDYFKEESIAWTWELLTKKFKLDPKRMAVSVFKGDDESAMIWQKQGLPKERIFYYGEKDNWWGLGDSGLCGPDTEVFYWTGDGIPQSEPAKDSHWLEIWNNVFMQYNKKPFGSLEPLENKNVDTGMGLERLATILQGKSTVYETDLFTPIVDRVKTLSASVNVKAWRIVADHIKAATFIIGDGVTPSNTDRGYVLRRLVRRAIKYAKTPLGIEQPFTADLAKIVINEFSDPYFPDVEASVEKVCSVLDNEEQKFSRTLDRGMKELDAMSTIDGKALFKVFETYGVPYELSLEMLGIEDSEGTHTAFDAHMLQHQEKSRLGSGNKFARSG